MASKINNLATLDYTSGAEDLSTNSNLASIDLQGPVTVAKYALETAYHLGDTITYHLFVTNGTEDELTNITIVDDLGKYALNATTNVVPLTYIKPAKMFVGDVLMQTIDGTVDPDEKSVSFLINTLAAGATAILSYKVIVNDYAPVKAESTDITNTVSVEDDDVAGTATATSTLPLAKYTDIVVHKTMTPEIVAGGDAISYTFEISNYGTQAATAAKLRDIFDPIPNITNVYLESTLVPSTSYSLDHDTGEFVYPTATVSTYAIGAATFTQDSVTGIVTTTPTTSTFKILATI